MLEQFFFIRNSYKLKALRGSYVAQAMVNSEGVIKNKLLSPKSTKLRSIISFIYWKKNYFLKQNKNYEMKDSYLKKTLFN
jgi:hypothetical protein